MATRTVQLQSARFAVLDRPVCVWDPLLAETNLRFLRGLDPTFFLYQATTHQHVTPTSTTEADDTRGAMHAAMALRISFGMGLESLFAVLGALVQAPHCVFGWLSSYNNAELVELVTRISNKVPIKSRPPFKPVTWGHIAEQLLLPLSARSSDEHQRLAKRFAEAWQNFAEDFCNALRSREYNSLKHSFRVQPAGFKVQFHHEKDIFFQSETRLGHTFPYLRKNPDRKRDHSVSRATIAFEPDAYGAALSIIASSISNAVAFARVYCGDDPANSRLHLPEDESVFDVAAKLRSPIQSMTYGGVSTPDKYLSDEEILAIYDDDHDHGVET